MAESVLARLIQLLQDAGVAFDVLKHEPVYTSEEAARVRGVSLSSGAKALVCKADGQRVMFVLPANLKLASKRIRSQCGVKSLRFASAAEVLDWTDLKPGSIPPFGSLFGLPTWCDQNLADEETINFNAGDHSVSVRMRYDDYVSIEEPRIGDFGDPSE